VTVCLLGQGGTDQKDAVRSDEGHLDWAISTWEFPSHNHCTPIM